MRVGLELRRRTRLSGTDIAFKGLKFLNNTNNTKAVTLQKTRLMHDQL